MTAKEKYISFAQQHCEIPAMITPWYMNALFGDAWDVVVKEENGEVIAALPFMLETEGMFDSNVTHPLQPVAGAFILPDFRNASQAPGILDDLFSSLPKMHGMIQAFTPELMPFLPEKMKKKTLEREVLQGFESSNAISETMDCDVYDRIQASEDEGMVIARRPLEDFFSLAGEFMKKEKITEDFLMDFDGALYREQRVKLFFADNAEGELQGAVWVILGDDAAYPMMLLGKTEEAKLFLTRKTIDYCLDKENLPTVIFHSGYGVDTVAFGSKKQAYPLVKYARSKMFGFLGNLFD